MLMIGKLLLVQKPHLFQKLKQLLSRLEPLLIPHEIQLIELHDLTYLITD